MVNTGISFEDKEMINGTKFESVGTTALSSAQNLIIGITAPASPDVLTLKYELSPSATCTISVYEGATVAGGVALTAYNCNRNNSYTNPTTIKRTYNVTAYGTTLSKTKITSTAASLAPPVIGTLMMYPEKVYVIRVYADVASNQLSWKLNWFSTRSI